MAGGPFYNQSLYNQLRHYEDNIDAYGKVCNRAGYEHDLTNIRALVQILDQQIQQENMQTSRSLKGKGVSDDLILRQLDRDRQNPNTQLGRDYNDSQWIHREIQWFAGYHALDCPPPTAVAHGGPPTGQPRQQRKGGAALLGH